MKNLIIADIDGCCINSDARLHHIEKRDWPGYHADWHLDVVIPQGALIYRMFLNDSNYRLVFVTAREESARDYTLCQLRRYVSRDITSEQLLMRGPNDHTTSGGTPDYILKPRLIREAGYSIDDIFLVFEDRQQMVDEWRRLGCIVYQTAPRLD